MLVFPSQVLEVYRWLLRLLNRLKLPIVITSASRLDSQEFSTRMGAMHTINRRGDLPPQIDALSLKVLLRYIFVTHSTEMYVGSCASICAHRLVRLTA